MEDKIRVSVAMATYNGEKYIKEQIESILINLKQNDELIISDDGSKDQTLEIIKQFNDDRIKIINGPHKGVKKNFENAIKETQGKYVFLADQDDIWSRNKVDNILDVFEKNQNIALIIHDASVFDSNSNEIIYDSFFKFRNSGSGILKNIYKNTYIGCCMAFIRELKKYILPIPNEIEMHDQWIGIMAEMKFKSVLFLDKILLQYRRHTDNVSKMNHYPLKKMIYNRIIFIKSLWYRRKNEKKL